MLLNYRAGAVHQDGTFLCILTATSEIRRHCQRHCQQSEIYLQSNAKHMSRAIRMKYF